MQSHKDIKIFVAGHRGMVGSAIVRELKKNGFHQIITRSREELDLTDQRRVREFFEKERPDQVYLAAAKVGGIYANSAYPADFIYQNLMIEANVINSSFKNNVRKLLFISSSAIYPDNINEPIPEEALLKGSPNQSHEAYVIAKIAGIKMCESYNYQYGVDYRSVIPCNLYGPGDNYHPENSHVIPALIRRFHEAKVSGANHVAIWGTGTPRREFLYVDDLARACVFIMGLEQSKYKEVTAPMRSHINVGYGNDITIAELARLIAQVVGFTGEIRYDLNKPDGTQRKLMDSSRIKQLGWQPQVDLLAGIELAYKDFLSYMN